MLRGEKFGGSFFKGGVAPKVEKVIKHRDAKAAENEQMAKARKRDGYCRFPECGCKAFAMQLHVAHMIHRGSGGNPAGDRTEPRLLILFCAARHRQNKISLDNKTLRVRPLNKRQGANGPCAYDIDTRALFEGTWTRKPNWFELARETARHVFEPFTPEQQKLLTKLKGMEL